MCGGLGVHVYCPLSAREKTDLSDYDINANLKISQRGVWLSRSGAWINTAQHYPLCS